MMRKIMLLPAVMLAVVLSAGEQIIRTGVLQEVKVLTAAPAVTGLEKHPYELPKNRVYVAVTIKLAENRTLSLLDYSLLLDGRIIHGAAITTPEAPKQFRCTTEVCRTPGVYQLLFIMDRERWERKQSLKFSGNLPPVNVYEVTL